MKVSMFFPPISNTTQGVTFLIRPCLYFQQCISLSQIGKARVFKMDSNIFPLAGYLKSPLVL